MEEQNFLVYSDKNDGKKCLYRNYTGILTITNRRVIYKFIMGNKHEVLGFKAKPWGSQPPEAIGDLRGGAPVFWRFL